MARVIKTRIAVVLFFLSLPISLFAYETPSDLFREAENRYFSRQYVIALGNYRELVEQFPLSPLVPDARYRIAVCLFRLERYQEAYGEFTAVEKRHRTTRYIEYVSFWKGTTAYYLGSYEEARKQLDSFLKKSSDPEFSRNALLYKALADLALDYYDDAALSMKSLVSERGIAGLNPYEAVIYSYTLLKTGAYEEVIALEKQIDTEQIPEQYRERFLLYRAEAYWGTGNNDEAGRIYWELVSELAMVSDETASVAYRRLYTIAQNEGDFPSMEDTIQKAEERLRGSGTLLEDLWMRIGIESYKRNELQLAEHFFKKVWNKGNYITMSPTIPLYLSDIYTKRGDTARARAVLDEYLSYSSKEPENVTLRLGNLLILEERYEEAASLLKPLAEAEGGEQARYLYAFCLYKLDQYDKALDELGKEEKGKVDRDALRLKATILIKLKRYSPAYDTLRQYVDRYPDDVGARLVIIKALFSQKRFSEVVSATNELLSSEPDLENSEPYTYLQANYLMGLSQISLKLYDDAIATLAVVTPSMLSRTGLDSLLPYREFYNGWAHYRTGKLAQAAAMFDDFTSRYPDHELYERALYDGGWCYYSLGEYRKAESLFSKLIKRGSSYLAQKAALLKGRALKNLNRSRDAKDSFESLYSTLPNSSYADDALFEHATMLAEEGMVPESASLYDTLVSRYPASELASESLYRKGELYFSHDLYPEARSSFAEYRTNYPKGKLIDASLYWEGMCAYKLEEPRAAVLLWEIIIDTETDSTFIPDALKFSAEVYASVGEYKKALSYYERLTDQYPAYAKAVKADLRLEEIRYLLFGLEKKEAELLALISKYRGIETEKGRDAMIDLSRIYIEENKKLERAFQMLSQVVLQKDPATEAEAQFLLGEYYYKKSDYVRAGEEFFNASMKKQDDRDFIAYAVFRSAQMMKLAGKKKDAEQLVERLEKFFPQSEWASEGRRLLESN
jgi:TolA-binding protein